MAYLEDRRHEYGHPQNLLNGARSVVMLGLAYRTAEPVEPQPGQARVSRYAWGDADYHDVIREKLHALADYLRELVPTATTRCVVDTAPLLERDFAQLAGLGWIGKNTLLIARPTSEGPSGSYFFLAALLTDLELQFDAPLQTDHCGTCTACLDACPTDAFVEPHVLDARRCISYLTIELRDHVPVELREGMGDWGFGCDVCQDVCPWNQKAPHSAVEAFLPRLDSNPLELVELFELDDEAFKRRFRKTPVWRSHREGLLRNAAIALGNNPTPAAVPALRKGLEDPHPLVREACCWALAQFDNDSP